MPLPRPPSSTAASASAPIGPSLTVGLRSTSMSSAQQTLGPVKITRHYYDQLPSHYQPLFPGVSEVVSFLRSTPANTAAFVKSIPAGTPVVIVYHHEPEGTRDYPGTPQQAGAKFVAEFNAQAAVVHANSKIPMGFIGGGYQYMKNHRGVGGYFIPTTADYYFEDTYAQNNAVVPATQDPEVQGYLTELRKKGKHFDGFTEYARGTASGSPSARASVIASDNAWLRSMGARVWIYWWGMSPQTGDNWKFTDSTSIAAWRKVAAQ